MLEKQQRSDAQLSERLASLGIIGPQLRAPLEPVRPSQHYNMAGLKGVNTWAPIMPRDASQCVTFLQSGLNSQVVFLSRIIFQIFLPQRRDKL